MFSDKIKPTKGFKQLNPFFVLLYQQYGLYIEGYETAKYTFKPS